ncbi:glycosyltransferase family 2 protein [Euzebya rosea]|uniref:glycosyltransferase family 2 protein n=1 Tax=Euzebya rosea TaxID=2052804 RepID=UPI000D3ED898|nr:glycosyltransferase family 2 protein [Euzebya rosea]
MLLSICVPTRNRPDMVRGLLQSLLALDPSELSVEILVGDNSTNDETEALMAQFPSVDYVRNVGDLGPYGNFNSLIARASGEWIHLIADDDVVEPGYLDGLVQPLHDDRAVIVTGRVGFVGGTPADTAAAAEVQAAQYARLGRMGIEFPSRIDGVELINRALIHGCPFEFSHTLVRRTAVIASGGFDRRFRLQGDYDLWLRLLGIGDAVFADVEMGAFRVYDANMLADRDAQRAYRTERLLIRLSELGRHLDLLAPDVRGAVIAAVRKDMARVRTFTRMGIGGPTADGMLTSELRRATDALEQAGLGRSLEPVLGEVIAHTPGGMLSTLFGFADAVRSFLGTPQDGGEIGERAPVPGGTVRQLVTR